MKGDGWTKRLKKMGPAPDDLFSQASVRNLLGGWSISGLKPVRLYDPSQDYPRNVVRMSVQNAQEGAQEPSGSTNGAGRYSGRYSDMDRREIDVFAASLGCCNVKSSKGGFRW